MENNYHLNRLFYNDPLVLGDVTILQIGRMFAKRNTVIEPHIQTNLYELTVVTDGEGIIYTNNVKQPVKRGDIYFSMPGDVHSIETDPVRLLKFDFLAFTVNGFLGKDFDRITERFHSPDARLFNDDRIMPLVSNAIQEINENEIYSKELLQALLTQILIYTVRGFNSGRPMLQSNDTSRAEQLCYKLMNYIDTHIYTLKNLEQLATVTGYSYGYISSLFKKTTANTLSNYFYEKKLAASRMLIKENKLTITEISELLNYSSVFAYSKAFTKKYGVSPKQYRSHQ